MDKQYPSGNRHILPCAHIYLKDFAQIAKDVEYNWVTGGGIYPLGSKSDELGKKIVIEMALGDGKLVAASHLRADDVSIVMCQTCGAIYALDNLLFFLVQNEVTAESIREDVGKKVEVEESAGPIESLEVE